MDITDYNTASCTYDKVYFIVTFIIVKLLMLVADIRISEAAERSVYQPPASASPYLQ